MSKKYEPPEIESTEIVEPDQIIEPVGLAVTPAQEAARSFDEAAGQQAYAQREYDAAEAILIEAAQRLAEAKQHTARARWEVRAAVDPQDGRG